MTEKQTSPPRCNIYPQSRNIQLTKKGSLWGRQPDATHLHKSHVKWGFSLVDKLLLQNNTSESTSTVQDKRSKFRFRRRKILKKFKIRYFYLLRIVAEISNIQQQSIALQQLVCKLEISRIIAKLCIKMSFFTLMLNNTPKCCEFHIYVAGIYMSRGCSSIITKKNNNV